MFCHVFSLIVIFFYPFLLQVRNHIIANGGSIADISDISSDLKEIYRTVWEIRQRSLIDMAADRGKRERERERKGCLIYTKVHYSAFLGFKIISFVLILIWASTSPTTSHVSPCLSYPPHVSTSLYVSVCLSYPPYLSYSPCLSLSLPIPLTFRCFHRSVPVIKRICSWARLW